MSDLLKLASRCEAATASNRSLDYAIYKATNASALECWPHWDEHQREMICPLFTGSIDIAASLVPQDFAWTLAALSDGKFWASVSSLDDEDGCPVQKHTATAALALCSAALQARHTLIDVGGARE